LGAFLASFFPFPLYFLWAATARHSVSLLWLDSNSGAQHSWAIGPARLGFVPACLVPSPGQLVFFPRPFPHDRLLNVILIVFDLARPVFTSLPRPCGKVSSPFLMSLAAGRQIPRPPRNTRRFAFLRSPVLSLVSPPPHIWSKHCTFFIASTPLRLSFLRLSSNPGLAPIFFLSPFVASSSLFSQAVDPLFYPKRIFFLFFCWL